GYRVIIVLAPLDEVIDPSAIEAMARRYGTVIVSERDGNIRYAAADPIDSIERLRSSEVRNYDLELPEHDLGHDASSEILRIERTFCHDVLVQTLESLSSRERDLVF